MTAPRADGFSFRVLAEAGHARTGVFVTPHADVETPTFMPVGTQGSVKGLTPDEVAATGARIVLGNTVIDHERVDRGDGVTPVFDVAAIYTFRDGKIARVDFAK